MTIDSALAGEPPVPERGHLGGLSPAASHEPAVTHPRVLVLYASQRLTGPGRGLLQLIGASGARQRFTLCTFGSPGSEPSDMHRAAVANGIDARVIEQRFALDPLMVHRVLNVAHETGYDLVQSHGYKTHLLAGVVSWRLKIPWLAVSHGWTNENWKIRFYNRIDRVLLSRADTVVAVSPLLHAAASRLRGGRRTVTILNAIERDRFEADTERASGQVRRSLGVSDDTLLLAVIGRLSPEKGQDLFLRAFSQVRGDSEGPVGLLVGEGPEVESLRNLTRKLGIEARVRFTGFQKNVHHYFRAADIIVLPSRSEGLPNVVLEAHALARPVIAFDVGGVSEVIRDCETGWLVRAGDVDGLARAMQEAIDDPARRRSVAEAATRSLFPKFGVEHRVAAFGREYRRLCAGPGEPGGA